MTAGRERGLDGPLVAGVDVGGTKTLVVVTDCRDVILHERIAPTDRTSLVGQIAGLVDDARRQLRQDIAAVGVAVPGFVDTDDGSVSMAVNLGITQLPLAACLLLFKEFSLLCFDESYAAALGWPTRRLDLLLTMWRGRLFPDNARYILRNTEAGWAHLEWFNSMSAAQISDLLIREDLQ